MMQDMQDVVAGGVDPGNQGGSRHSAPAVSARGYKNVYA